MTQPTLPLVNGAMGRRGAPGRSQRGFTLIELMVSVALGLLLMVALIAVFLNVSRTNTEMAKTNSLIENGRFAIDILQEDIAHAGFWGGYVPRFDDLSWTAVPGDAPSLATDPCLAFNATNWTTAYKDALIGIPVQSYDASPTGCTALVTNKKASTDVLVVRHAANCLPEATNCEAENASKVYFQASFCEKETEDRLLTDPYPLSNLYRYKLSNTTADFTLKKRGCTGTPPGTVGTAADKRKFISNIYYIRTHAVTPGDGIPTLMRSSFNLVSGTPAHETPVALIEGIEGFAVELGIDAKSRCDTSTNYTNPIARVSPSTCTAVAIPASPAPNPNTLPTNRGDGVPEAPFVRCTSGAPCTNVQLRDVVAVKLYVLARSLQTTPGHTDSKTYALGSTTLGPFNDGFKRHVFQTTVRLTNLSGRRETP